MFEAFIFIVAFIVFFSLMSTGSRHPYGYLSKKQMEELSAWQSELRGKCTPLRQSKYEDIWRIN